MYEVNIYTKPDGHIRTVTVETRADALKWVDTIVLKSDCTEAYVRLLHYRSGWGYDKIISKRCWRITKE